MGFSKSLAARWSHAAAILCLGACWMAGSAAGQASRAAGFDPRAEKDKIVEQAFTKCPTDGCQDASYYMEMSLPVLACNMGDVFSPQGYHELKTCRAVFQYKDPEFNVAADKLSPADVANGLQWRGWVAVNYQISRVRHIADGVWGPWERWNDKPEARPYLLVHYWYSNGQWTVGEVGPDLFKIPVAFEDVVKTKPAYADIANPASHPELPKPIERPVQAATPMDPAEYKRRGIPPSISPDDLSTFYVCYAVTPMGQCQRTGEIVQVPGDLAAPLDWAAYVPGQSLPCPVRGGVEVTLKNPNPDDGKKRYLRCADAVRLAGIHRQFVQLGAAE